MFQYNLTSNKNIQKAIIERIGFKNYYIIKKMKLEFIIFANWVLNNFITQFRFPRIYLKLFL